MRIVHLCLFGPYNDQWGYQENLLPLHHLKLGHDVFVVARNSMFGSNGRIVDTAEGGYRLENGLHVIRLSVKPLINLWLGKAYLYYEVYDLLVSLRPDFVMIHGLNSITSLQVLKYKQTMNSDCIIVADTHVDGCNFPRKSTIKNRLYFFSLQILNRYCVPSYSRVFGITPACIDYAVENFKIPRTRLELLPLGCDMDEVKNQEGNDPRTTVRQKYGLLETDFVVVTGGKLDRVKNTHTLIEAVGATYARLTLVVFGPLLDEYKETIMRLVEKHNEKVVYIGILSVQEIYGLYLAADLAIFPGRESVLWQQAIACGLPAVFKKWPGTEYLDVGGNCLFLERADCGEIKAMLETLTNDREKVQHMKAIARTSGASRFSYLEIARQALAL